MSSKLLILKDVLLKHGFTKSEIKEKLQPCNENFLESSFQMLNELEDPFLLFHDIPMTPELLGQIKVSLPSIGIVVQFDSEGLIKNQIRNFADNSFVFSNKLEKPKSIFTTKDSLYGSVDEGFRKLNNINNEIEGVFFEAHSIVRDIDGLHPDQALDEICKFIYAKLYDEETYLPNNSTLLQKAKYSTIEETASIVRSLYNNSLEYDERIYSLRVPKYKKSRGVFNTTLNLSSPALFKLVELFEDIDLTSSEIDVKGRAFQKMLLPAMRAGMGQYFTPLPVIKFIVETLQPKSTDLIIDPFSGSAHFLTSAMDYVARNEKNVSEKRMNEFRFHKLHGIEKSERMVRISMTDMRLHGDGHSNIRCTDALLSFESYEDLKENSFDIVMSNPPFGSLLSSEAVDRLGSFQLMEGRKTLPLEVLGLERCIQLLRPKGKFGIVLPESIITNKNTKYVREWLLDKTQINSIVSLPLETFSPFGANIKTIVIFGTKKRAGQKNKKHKVFAAKIESVGYDFKGMTTDDSTINDITKELKLFLENHE